MDADGSHPAPAVPRTLDTAVASGAGLVNGSRYVEATLKTRLESAVVPIRLRLRRK